MKMDLWPNFDITPSTSSPRLIIANAGAGLEDKTNGLVAFYLGEPALADGIVSFDCSLSSRALQYNYPFLKVRFPLVDGYPVELVADKVPEKLRAATEQELLELLGRVFKMPTTIHTVQQLISLSE